MNLESKLFMKTLFSSKIAILLTSTIFLTSCARDLSSNVYTSSSTLSLTLEGEVISVRPVIVKDTDKLSDNVAGGLAGGAMGGVLGSGVGNGTGKGVAVVGGAIAGSVLGSVVQGKLEEKKGYEYIVKVDTSKLKSDYYEGSSAMRNAISSATTSGLITIIQGTGNVLKEGQKVYVIFSDKRTRIIPCN